MRTFKNLHAAWLLDYGTAVTKTSWNLLTFQHLNVVGWKLDSVYLYKIINKLCYFDETTFTISTSLSHHAPHNLALNRPFAGNNSYFYSFVSQTIFHWNTLDSSIVCASSVHAFKVARSPVFSRSTNLESKLIEFFVFVKFQYTVRYQKSSDTEVNYS